MSHVTAHSIHSHLPDNLQTRHLILLTPPEQTRGHSGFHSGQNRVPHMGCSHLPAVSPSWPFTLSKHLALALSRLDSGKARACSQQALSLGEIQKACLGNQVWPSRSSCLGALGCQVGGASAQALVLVVFRPGIPGSQPLLRGKQDDSQASI